MGQAILLLDLHPATAVARDFQAFLSGTSLEVEYLAPELAPPPGSEEELSPAQLRVREASPALLCVVPPPGSAAATGRPNSPEVLGCGGSR